MVTPTTDASCSFWNSLAQPTMFRMELHESALGTSQGIRMPTAASAQEKKNEKTGLAPTESRIRGAESLVLAAAGNAARDLGEQAGLVGLRPTRQQIKKAHRVFAEAVDALDARRFAAAEQLFDEGILLLLDSVPSRILCYRLVAAAKAANYEYVVNNYHSIRNLASNEEERTVVDRVWIDCLTAAGFYREAIDEVERLASGSAGASPAIKTALGVIHARLGEHDKAISIQKAILEQDPDNVLARWNLSMHQLEAGCLPEAFDNYEARWNWSDFPSERPTFGFPRWSGEPLEGKRVLVWREQGIGDEIRFAGILPDLIDTGARITFECSPKLLPLFRLAFPQIDIRPMQPPELRKPVDYLHFDFEVPLGSLARHFRPTVAEMRARCRPWLSRDEEIENRLRADVGATREHLVIGLCWRSTNRNLYRNHHYIRAEYLTPLKLLGKAKFICLQYDECRDELAAMREMGLPIYDFPNINQMDDLVSASYLAGACDLIVTAGTATAELAAGLGISTVLFGLKKSQIQLGTDGVPWHPATRFIPLNPADPIGVAKSILFDWKDIAAWAEQNSTSGRRIDWQMSFPGAA